MLEPTSGQAEVLSFDTWNEGNEVRTGAGALLEHPGIYEQVTAEDNLDFYPRAWRMPSGEPQARIRVLVIHMGS